LSVLPRKSSRPRGQGFQAVRKDKAHFIRLIIYHVKTRARNRFHPDGGRDGDRTLTSHGKAGLAALLFLTLFLCGAAGESLDLNLYLHNIVKAGPPAVFGDFIVFSCATRVPARVVGARFSHEDFRFFHAYRKNDSGIYVLALPAPAESRTLKYRIMIDGVWMADPANPLSDTDEQGIVFSLAAFEQTAPVTTAVASGPRLTAEGEVEFNLEAESGSIVTVAGDFNNYDPFTQRLSEVSPGLYRLRLRLLPGRHYYCFIVNGVRRVDPQNERVVYDADRQPYSPLVIR
jgi:hypothetical protein